MCTAAITALHQAPVAIWPILACAFGFLTLLAGFKWSNRKATYLYFDPQDFVHYENGGGRKLPLAAEKGKFLTVVCNLETAEPLWFGRERKQETLDDFFRSQLVSRQRKRIEAACVDMWEPFRLSMAEWVPGCRIVYDKFHIMQHANDDVDEVRRAEFFRKGRKMRDVIK